MKLAYVTPYGPEYVSIHSHTERRQNEWRAGNVEVSHHILGSAGRRSRGALANLWCDLRAMRQLISLVRQERPHVIYLRWLSPLPGMLRALSEVAPVVLEIHANDYVETIRSSFLRRLYAGAFRNRELARAAGATFVTDEMLEDPAFRPVSGPRGVFPNGSALEPRPSAPVHVRPKVGMSVGAVLPWSGIDIFGTLARQMPDVDFVLAAPATSVDDVAREAGPGVLVVGTTNADEYVAELSTWTAGIGTLALYRKGIVSATPLKVRDYIGLGVPAVIPYLDPGLLHVDDPCVLLLAEDCRSPQPLDRVALRNFLARVSGLNVGRPAIDAISLRRIEKRRLEFLKSFALQ